MPTEPEFSKKKVPHPVVQWIDFLPREDPAEGVGDPDHGENHRCLVLYMVQLVIQEWRQHFKSNIWKANMCKVQLWRINSFRLILENVNNIIYFNHRNYTVLFCFINVHFLISHILKIRLVFLIVQMFIQEWRQRFKSNIWKANMWKVLLWRITFFSYWPKKMYIQRYSIIIGYFLRR